MELCLPSNRPRCHTKSPTAQDVFLIPGFIDQLCWDDWEMHSDSWSYSNGWWRPSLCAAVLCATCLKIIRSDCNH